MYPALFRKYRVKVSRNFETEKCLFYNNIILHLQQAILEADLFHTLGLSMHMEGYGLTQNCKDTLEMHEYVHFLSKIKDFFH